LKRIILLLAVTAILVLALAVPAFAQGKFEQGTEQANSICSYSGLNDNDPEEEGFDLGRVQSYGDYVKEGIKAFLPSPGEECNGHLHPLQENPPEE
jgi:hypothetical protein